VNKARAVVDLIIVLFFVAEIWFFTYLKQAIVASNLKYPPTFECNKYSYSETIMKEFAELDRDGTDKGQGLGYYQCYCKSYSTLSQFWETEHLCYNYQ
jgi:hypothetical protein